MREDKLYARVRPHLQKWGAISRIENYAEPGTWDIFYGSSGQMNWIETKVIHGQEIMFEKFQLPWGRRFFKEGVSNLFILAGFEDNTGFMMVYHVKEVINAPTYTKPNKKDKVYINIGNLNPIFGLSRPYDWDPLRTLLSTQYPINK